MGMILIMRRKIHIFDILFSAPFVSFAMMFSVMIDTDILSYLEKPILKILAFLKHMGFLVKPEKGLLDDIQSIFLVVEIGIGKKKNLSLVKASNVHECFSVAIFYAFDQAMDIFVLDSFRGLHSLMFL